MCGTAGVPQEKKTTKTLETKLVLLEDTGVKSSKGQTFELCKGSLVAYQNDRRDEINSKIPFLLISSREIMENHVQRDVNVTIQKLHQPQGDHFQLLLGPCHYCARKTIFILITVN